MGFFDFLGDIAKVALPIVGGLLTGGTGAQAAATVAAVGQTVLTSKAAQAAAATPTAVAVIPTVAATTVIPGVTGAANVFTRTLVQRIDRATGVVLSEEIKMGSPWLMRSEVRALKRVTKAIRKADSKITRKAATVSTEVLDKAVQKRITDNLLLTAIQHSGHHGS